MKKKIFHSFILVLSIALLLNSAIFYLIVNSIMLDNTKRDMLSILRIMDYSLDIGSNLQEQLVRLQKIAGREKLRFTIIDISGLVLADNTMTEISSIENHGDREEIREAMQFGIGYAKRYSSTLSTTLLYVAALSANGSYLLRIATPLYGDLEYLFLMLPAIVVSVSVSLMVSSILARRFSNTITRPLRNIAREMRKIRGDNPEFEFETYQYDELNIIAETSATMAKSIREYIDKIELEKKIRQEFFSNASHELKTPITSVKGYTDLVEGGFAKDEKTEKEFLSRIKKETENMTGLINDILMISRLETKEAVVTISDVRVWPLLEEVTETLRPLAEECDVTIEMECKPLVIQACYEQIRELISNLISNGIKYNKQGGSVSILITQEGQEMVLVVSDTGHGISEEEAERVFERFYRIDKGRNKKMGGTGLGLSIVKHIVSYYNGTIHLDSKQEEGCTFTVRLPLHRL